MHPSIFALKRAYLATRNVIERELKPYGITKAQLDVMLYLYHQPGLDQRSLQPLLGVTAPTLSRLIDGMERKELIYRKANKADSRVNNLMLGQPGLELLERLRGENDRFFAAFSQGFTEDEMNKLTEQLLRIEKNMDGLSR